MRNSRVRELERLHKQISKNKSTFSVQDLERFIKQKIEDNVLPPQVSLSQFMQAYENEISRLEQYEQTIIDNLNHYEDRYEEAKQKLEEYQETEEKTPEGIAVDSTLELIVDQARDLSAMNINNTADAYFIIKVDGDQVFQSGVIPNTSQPVWNERLSIPIDFPDQMIDIEIWDYDEYDPEHIGKVQIDLDTLRDQVIHNRWYELYGMEDIKAGELKLTLQWIHSMEEYYENTLDRLEQVLEQTEALQDAVAENLKGMREGTGKDLLLAWFRPLPDTPNTSRPNSRQEGDFVSLSSSKINTTLTSPKEGNRNRSEMLSFEKVLYGSDSDIKSSINEERRKANLFAIGLYLSMKSSYQP